MRSVRAALTAAAVTAAMTVVAGCAGVPHSGSVHAGRELPVGAGLDDAFVKVLPPLPTPGMSRTAVVTDLLRAMVNSDDHYAIARAYLTPRAGAAWTPTAGTTVYDDAGVRVVATSVDRVEVRANGVGRIDARGGYRPSTRPLDVVFRLARVAGEWRVSSLPNGVLMSSSDVQRSLRLASVYYLAPGGRSVVPEPLFVPPEPRGLATMLVRRLLDGPGAQLQGAVVDAIPAGTELLGNVPVDADGLAEVNLSAAARQLSSSGLQAVAAQLGWTLRQVVQISGVRLFVDGAPISSHSDAARTGRDGWAAWDPDAPATAARAVVADAGALRTGDGVALTGRLGDGSLDLTSPAVSADGTTVAALQRSVPGWSLWTGSATTAPLQVLGPGQVSAPAFDPVTGRIVVATGPRAVVSVVRAGNVEPVRLDTSFPSGPVQALRFSRDGCRIAAVVGRPGAGALYVGSVVRAGKALSLRGMTALLPAQRDVRGVAWAGADQLVVTVSTGGGHRQVLATDVAGFSVRTLPSSSALPIVPVAIAAAPGRPVLVADGAHVYELAAGGVWRVLSRGGAPAYPA